MMRKKNENGLERCSFGRNGSADCLQDVEVMEERKVRVEALQQVLPRQESSASDTTDTSDRPTYKIATVRWTRYLADRFPA